MNVAKLSEVRVNYIPIPKEYSSIVRELYYFENLDLVLIIDMKCFFVFKI